VRPALTLLSIYAVPPIKEALITVYGPPEAVPRYNLYPLIFDDVLAVQLSVTECWTGSSVPVKFTPLILAFFIVSVAVDGENANPDWLGATRYEPFVRLEKL
jgi:hypothetical protein